MPPAHCTAGGHRSGTVLPACSRACAALPSTASVSYLDIRRNSRTSPISPPPAQCPSVFRGCDPSTRARALHEAKDMRERLDANGLLDRGADVRARRQWKAAVGYVTEATELGLEDDSLPKALLLRGMCSMRAGELDFDLDDLTSALNIDFSNETAMAAYPLRGRCHLKTHQWHLAQSDFSNAIIAGSKDADTICNRLFGELRTTPQHTPQEQKFAGKQRSQNSLSTISQRHSGAEYRTRPNAWLTGRTAIWHWASGSWRFRIAIKSYRRIQTTPQPVSFAGRATAKHANGGSLSRISLCWCA